MNEQTLASSAGKTQPHSVMFQVSDEFLAQARLGDWSETVQFKFEQHEDGTYDLVMRTVEPA